MGINQIRWREVFNEAQDLAQIANQLTREVCHQKSKNIWGRPEWEYGDRVWFRKVLPLIGGAPGAAFQTRLAHFAVEARSFLVDMQALKHEPLHCQDKLRAAFILYDDSKIPQSFGISWQLFLVQYEIIRKAIMAVLKTQKEITFMNLSRAVEKEVGKKFEGSVLWYVTTVKLDLEARGEIKRVTNSRPQLVKLVR